MPYGSRRDPWGALLVYLQSNVPFSSAEEKYHRPCYGKQGKTCFSSKRKEEYSFSKGKRKGRSFCTVTKGTKNTEKGRGIPLPFSIPSPLQQRISKPLGMHWACGNCKMYIKQKNIEQKSRDK